MMNILACADDNYAMQCGVLFLSICENNRDTSIRFFVMTDGAFQEHNRAKLEDIIHRYRKDNTLEIIMVDDDLVKDFLPIISKFYPKQVLYRLFAVEMLPKEIDKVLYLDCDIIVRHSLDGLWNENIEGFSVACVPDALSGLVGIYNRLRYPQRYGYFNSGVLLLNLFYWRKHHISEQFRTFAKTTDVHITLPDQDILNVVLHESKLFLPLTFNLQSGFLYKVERMSFDYYGHQNELSEACIDPVVLHLAGERPWYKGSKHPYKDEYYRYKAMTVWKDEPLKTVSYSVKDDIKRVVRLFLCKLGLLNPIADPYNRKKQLV